MPSDAPWFLRARLKTRQLLLLVALAEQGNIHRAAQAMSITQPAASKLLKDLEEALGVALFERLPRGMRATGYGETLVRHARMVLAHLGQAGDEIAAQRAGRLGQVAVGAIASPGLALLPTAIGRVKLEHPLLSIVLEVDSSPVLLERLVQGRLDIALARLGTGHDKRQFRYQRLAEEPICVMVRNGHALLSRTDPQLQDVADAAWIVPPAGSVLRHRFELMFQAQGLPAPANLVETASHLFMTRMLQQSDMLAVVSTEVARYYADHGLVCILPLALACQMDHFGLVTLRDRLPSPGATVVLRALAAACLQAYGRKLAVPAAPG